MAYFLLEINIAFESSHDLISIVQLLEEVIISCLEFIIVHSELTIDVSRDESSLNYENGSYNYLHNRPRGDVYHCKYESGMIKHLHIHIKFAFFLIPYVCLNSTEIKGCYPGTFNIQCHVKDASLDMHDDSKREDDDDSSQLSLRFFRRLHVSNCVIDFPESH